MYIDSTPNKMHLRMWVLHVVGPGIGVRLRSSSTRGPMPPPECDLGTACIETQCLAYADPGDPKLTFWTKAEVPFLSLPPPNMHLTAWRDPYIIGRPGIDGQDWWTIMVGAGIKERGGTALIYQSKTLRGEEWLYKGQLCLGAGDTGIIWECPVMMQLPRLPIVPTLPVHTQPCHAATTMLQSASFLSCRGNVSTAPNRRCSKMAWPIGQQAQERAAVLILPSPSPRPHIGGVPDADSVALAMEDPGRHLWAPDASMMPSPRPPAAPLPQATLSQLRSPARWHLPALHTLPHAPSPPAPRPSSMRPLANAAVVSPLVPGQQVGVGLHRTSPPSSRLHSSAPMHGLPGGPSGPAGAVAALLASSPELAPLFVSPTLSAEMPLATTATAVLEPPKYPRSLVADHAPAVRIMGDWKRYQTFFCVCPDDCNSMAVYYLGSYDPDGFAFDLSTALGPFPLDLGDIFYAPNTLTDPEGRAVLWGWLQEKPRKVGAYDYAGCLSLPRLLQLEVEEQSEVAIITGKQPPVHLVQRPPPDITKLRILGSEWLAEGLLLEPGSTVPVPLAVGHHLELELAMLALPQPLSPFSGPGDTVITNSGTSTSRCSGVLLHSWRSGAEGAAALMYHWDSCVLELVFEAMDPATLTFSLAAPGVRRVGGRLRRPPVPGSPLVLRVFLDFSCLEVFTGAGEVLTARVYRGSAPGASGHYYGLHGGVHGSSAGVELVSFGCSTEFTSVGAYEMGSHWVQEV